MSRREVQWERLFPDELEAALAACPAVYLPYGLCEPHGPQNALGMDALRAHGICCRAAAEFGGIVAPPSYWHIHELGIYAAWAEPLIGEARHWLTAIPPWLFLKNLCYHLRAVDALGFKAAIAFTGHGGPHNADLPLVAEVMQPHLAMRFDIVHDGGFDGVDYVIGNHAGQGETALLWALDPDCVDTSRLPRADDSGPFFAMAPDAPQANRRRGEHMVSEAARWLGQRSQALMAEYDAQSKRPEPLSFQQTERIWREELEPRIDSLASMQPLAPGQIAPAPGSQWARNWPTQR